MKALALAVALLATGCSTAGWTLTLSNQTGTALTYAPVETDPPPPHRVVTDRTLADGTRLPIDLDDFNPVWWDPVSNLGFIVQHQFESSPRELLVIVLQYVVPPGQGQNDPALQPQQIEQFPFAVDEASGQQTIRIRAGPIASQIPITFSQE